MIGGSRVISEPVSRATRLSCVTDPTLGHTGTDGGGKSAAGTQAREGAAGTQAREGAAGIHARESAADTQAREGAAGTQARQGAAGTQAREGVAGTQAQYHRYAFAVGR